jgi:hypothetical protein
VDSPHIPPLAAKGPWPYAEDLEARSLRRPPASILADEGGISEMTAKTPGFTQHAAAAAGLLIALGFAAAPAAVLAQGQVAVSRSESVSDKLTIKSIDPATRHVIVTNSAGENTAMKVPLEVQNFGQLKPGDTINATYTMEAELVLSPPNTKLPPDTDTRLAARAAKGELPAGAVASHIVVTGAVVGIDKEKHTLKIVSPQGGEVHAVKVATPEGVKAMQKIKVGDTITAYLTESLLLTADPA